MSSHFGNKIWMGVALLASGFAGCASVPKTITTPHVLIPSANVEAITGIRSWFAHESSAARSLYVTGDITVDQDGESNSASFSMKSKRFPLLFSASYFDSPRKSKPIVTGTQIDSLSIEITGPFGIKVARFLASPEQYEYYDILHGQTLHGTTDQQSLEQLTHLHGVSLQSMNDLIYGLAAIDSSIDDSIQYYSDQANHFALVLRKPGIFTAAYDFDGTRPRDSANGNISLVRYRRWEGTPKSLTAEPALDVQFSDPASINGLEIPQHIEATAGANKLTLQYDHVELNPPALVVKIKMP